MEKKLMVIKEKIEKIKAQLNTIGEMRPGSLTKQKRGASGTYYQLSYTHKGRGRTEYVRPEFASGIKKQVANYRQFKKMIDQWVELEIERSKIKMKIEMKKEKW